MDTNSNKVQTKPYGMVGELNSAKTLLSVATRLNEAGYQHYEMHSPYPIHGLDAKMKLPDSKLGWIVISGAILGFFIAVVLQIWAMSVAYPFKISGKPLVSIEAFVPIIFELTILFAAFAAVFGMFALNKLPQWYHPIFEHSTIKDVTSHKFFVSIESKDTQYQTQKTTAFLKKLGATNIEEVFSEK